MGSQGGEHRFRCPCFEVHTDYQKVADLKDVGLVIYRQTSRVEDVSAKENTIKSATTTSEDVFILHNTNDTELLSADIVQTLDVTNIGCPRCKQRIENAKRLLKSIPKINRNDILGICDHCRRKLSRTPCQQCNEVVRKFVAGRDESQAMKRHIRKWLSKIHRLLKDVMFTEKHVVKRGLTFSDNDIQNLHHNSPTSLPGPDIGNLLYSGTLRTGSTKSLDLSDRSYHSHPVYPRPKKRTTFAEFPQREYFTDSQMRPFVSKSQEDLAYPTKDESLSLLDALRDTYHRDTKSTADLSTLQRLKTARRYKSGDIFDPSINKPSKAVTKKSKSEDYLESLSDTSFRKPSKTTHSKYEPEDAVKSFTDLFSRKPESEISTDGNLTKEGFGYLFLKEADEKAKEPKKRISSSELIKNTQDMLNARAEEERQRQEEKRRKKEEEEERRRKAREEKQLQEEKEKVLREEAKKLAEEEARRFAAEEKKRLAEQEKIRSAEEKAKKLADKEAQENVKKEQNTVAKEQKKKQDKKETAEKPDLVHKKKVTETTSKDKESIKEKKGFPEDEKKKDNERKEKPKIVKEEKLKPPKEVVSKVAKEDKPKSTKEAEKPKPAKEVVQKSKPEEVVEKPKKEKPEPIGTEKDSVSKDKALQKNKYDGKKEVPEKQIEEKDAVKKEVKEPAKTKEVTHDDEFRKLLAEQAKEREERRKLKLQKEEEDRKAREEAEKVLKEMKSQQAKSASDKAAKKQQEAATRPPSPGKKQEKPTTKELNIKQIKVKNTSGDDLILQLVKLKQKAPPEKPKTAKQEEELNRFLQKHRNHKNKVNNCLICNNSDIELDLESIENQREEEKTTDIIIGEKIFKYKGPLTKKHEEGEQVPILFKSNFKETSELKPIEEQKVIPDETEAVNQKKPVTLIKGSKGIEQEVPKGIVRYALSDRTFIDKGWTMLPTEKVVRKMNVYRMRPAQPEFDWFEHNKNKRLMQYDTGEKLAEFDDKGRGRWYYKNGRLALDYYDAEEINAQQRYVVYSSGEPDERGRSRPITILATFDYLGNGVVFDHSGKIRLKYNQTEGVVLDRAIGPVSHWKWHTLNDPPVLQQVMIDTQMSYKDPDIVKLGGPGDTKTRPDNEEMLAIEFDNFIKEKSKKLTQKFKPFQIKMKALKINECFSLKVLDQATVYLIFREGSANLKLNIGMILDHKEIVDTDTAEVGEVSNSLERLPARTESIAGMQASVAHAQRVERARVERERRLRPGEPCASADRLAAAATRPLRTPFRVATPPDTEATTPTNTTTTYPCRCRKPTSSNLYYDTRLI